MACPICNATFPAIGFQRLLLVKQWEWMDICAESIGDEYHAHEICHGEADFRYQCYR